MQYAILANMINTKEANSIVKTVISEFKRIGSPNRDYSIDRLPDIIVSDNVPHAAWESRTGRIRAKTNHQPTGEQAILISGRLIEERARQLDPRPNSLLNNALYFVEGLYKRTAEHRVAVASAVLTLEAITSSHKYSRPTQEEYANLATLLNEIGHSANFVKRQD